jgi:hypothetical protein
MKKKRVVNSRYPTLVAIVAVTMSIAAWRKFQVFQCFEDRSQSFMFQICTAYMTPDGQVGQTDGNTMAVIVIRLVVAAVAVVAIPGSFPVSLSMSMFIS